MQKRRLILKEKKKISKECWNLDSEFFKWLEIRLKTYLKEAGKYVDLKYYKFAVDDKELSQEEIIKKMLVLLEEIRKIDYQEEPYDKCNYKEANRLYKEKIQELCKLWGVVLPSMWW